MKILGIALVVLGLIGLMYGGISWTHREKVLDVGPLQVTHDEHDYRPIPPLAGGVAVAAGLVLLLKKGRPI
jgi:hypothetical protein